MEDRLFRALLAPCFLIFAVANSISTLFTGQNYILDVLGGYVLALAGYCCGLCWAGLFPLRIASRKGSYCLLLPEWIAD